MIRLHVGDGPAGLATGDGLPFDLPDPAARHLQVLRVQPGERVECFDGRGLAFVAEVVAMRRQGVSVRWLEPAAPASTELPVAVTLAVGMPANDRMDALVEKAVELGAAALQPLVCERSVLRLAGERAERKVAHWQAVAVSASEQCGRRVVADVRPVLPLAAWLAGLGAPATRCSSPTRIVLSLAAARAVADAEGHPAPPEPGAGTVMVLSGPEGGLTDNEEAASRRAGFTPVSLGPRVLRADTAPLAWLARFGARFES